MPVVNWTDAPFGEDSEKVCEADGAPEVEVGTGSVDVITEEVGETEKLAVPTSTVKYIPATRGPRPLLVTKSSKLKTPTPAPGCVMLAGGLNDDGCV